MRRKLSCKTVKAGEKQGKSNVFSIGDDMGNSDNDKLIRELTAIIKEFGKPARIIHSVHDGDDSEDDKFIREFLELLANEDDEDEKKEEPESSEEKEVDTDDFETFVGGLVVDAVEVEDDGERMYFCSIDDDAFYMPKAVFEKYFVKI